MKIFKFNKSTQKPTNEIIWAPLGGWGAAATAQ